VLTRWEKGKGKADDFESQKEAQLLETSRTFGGYWKEKAMDPHTSITKRFE